MSIYFVQVISSLLGFVLFAALNNDKKSLKALFLPSVLGIAAGIVVFKIARLTLHDAGVKMLFDAATLVFLLVSALWIFIKFNPAKMITFFALGAGYGLTYSHASANFPVFAGELLDTQSIISLFLMIFAFLLLLILFFVVSNLKECLCKHVLRTFSLLLLVVLIVQAISNTGLEFMRAGMIPTYPWALSLVAKGIYYTTFAQYFFIFLVLVLAVINFKKRPAPLVKSVVGSNKFRFNNAARNFMAANSKSSITIVVTALIFGLYYDLHASKPPEISDPIIVEPVNNEFKFDVEKLADNELHRYAYINDEGREIRFFLLNRFSDRASPIIVFDACAICGDMGYVKKGGDLICISCNVRIFLPSVGKEGGCNPIPMPFEFDGKFVTVTLDTIQSGANYFSKVVEKTVLDPVSRKKVSNIGSKSYLYYNRTYFFENEKTQAEFEANPEKYVDINGTLK